MLLPPLGPDEREYGNGQQHAREGDNAPYGKCLAKFHRIFQSALVQSSVNYTITRMGLGQKTHVKTGDGIKAEGLSMVKLTDKGAYLIDGTQLVLEDEQERLEQLGITSAERDHAREGTIAHSILSAHTITDDLEHLRIKFDAMASHDITYVGIIQTGARLGHEEVSAALCADQLPQYALRRGRNHQ